MVIVVIDQDSSSEIIIARTWIIWRREISKISWISNGAISHFCSTQNSNSRIKRHLVNLRRPSKRKEKKRKVLNRSRFSGI